MNRILSMHVENCRLIIDESTTGFEAVVRTDEGYIEFSSFVHLSEAVTFLANNRLLHTSESRNCIMKQMLEKIFFE